MSARARWLKTSLRKVWWIPAVLLPFAVQGPGVLVGLMGWFSILVGKIIGMEHIEIGKGAVPANAFGCWASAVLYLVLCVALGTAWHLLAERWLPES
jgi:hypothetical protein